MLRIFCLRGLSLGMAQEYSCNVKWTQWPCQFSSLWIIALRKDMNPSPTRLLTLFKLHDKLESSLSVAAASLATVKILKFKPVYSYMCRKDKDRKFFVLKNGLLSPCNWSSVLETHLNTGSLSRDWVWISTTFVTAKNVLMQTILIPPDG